MSELALLMRLEITICSWILLGLLSLTATPGALLAQNVDALAEDPTPPSEASRNATKPAEKKAPPVSNVSLSYYFDARGFNTLHIQTASNTLPLGLNVFGFTDLHDTQRDPANHFDMTRYFMEYRLRRPLNPEWVFGLKGMGLELEYNDFNGSGNRMVRAGLTLNHTLPFHLNGWLQWRYAPYESDRSGAFAGLVYSIPVTRRSVGSPI